MPLEESFSPTPEQAAPVAAPEPAAVAPEVAPEPAQAPEPVQPQAEAPQVAPEPANAPAPEAEPATPAEPVAVAPAFNEADFFKQALGDDAPKSAAELKEQIEGLKTKQITPEVEAQLAILRDPAKMAEFASIVGKDYDKPTAAEVMREKFALDNPKMPASLQEREFGKQFSERFPLVAQALADPTSVDPEDPAFKEELEAADWYSQADREALKEAQKQKTQQFIAATAAPQAPPLTPAQEADAKALPAWLDEAFKDGATLPVDLGDGSKLALPIQNAADFKAAFNDTYRLLDTHAFNADKTINRGNQALITAFLQLGPTAFVQQVAQQARASVPAPEPAIPLGVLANSSQRPPAPAPQAAPAAKRPSADTAWQNFNV